MGNAHYLPNMAEIVFSYSDLVKELDVMRVMDSFYTETAGINACFKDISHCDFVLMLIK